MPRRPRKVASYGLLNWRDLSNGSKKKLAKNVVPEISQPASASQSQTGLGTFDGMLPNGSDPVDAVLPASGQDSSSQMTPWTTTDLDTFAPCLPGSSAQEQGNPQEPESDLLAAAGRAGLSRTSVEARLNKRLGKSGKQQLLNAVRSHYKDYAVNSNIRGLGFPREEHLPYLPVVDLWVLAEKMKLTNPFALAFNITLEFSRGRDKTAPGNRCMTEPGRTSPYCLRPGPTRAALQNNQDDVQPMGYLEIQQPPQQEQEPSGLQDQGRNPSNQYMDLQHEQQAERHAECWQQESPSEEHQQLTLTHLQHELHLSGQAAELPGSKEGMPHTYQYSLQEHPEAQNGGLYGQPQQQDHADYADYADLPQVGLQDGHQAQSCATPGVAQSQLQLQPQRSHPQQQLPSDETQRVLHESSHEETELPLFRYAPPRKALSLGSGSNTCRASLGMLSASRISRIRTSSDVNSGAAEARASAYRSLLSQLSCDSDEIKSDEDENDEEWQPWATPQHRGVEPRLFGTDPAWHYAH